MAGGVWLLCCCSIPGKGSLRDAQCHGSVNTQQLLGINTGATGSVVGWNFGSLGEGGRSAEVLVAPRAVLV